MDLTNYNIKTFCNEADIRVEDMDSDFWLQLDRTTRCELVRCWWLDNDQAGYSAGKGAEKCAEFFCSKTNSIRGLQNETFKDQLAPWQAGYKSYWRAAAVYAARDNSDKYTEPSTEEQKAALKFLGEAGLTVEQAKEAFDDVVQLAGQARETFEAVSQGLIQQVIPAMQQLVDAAADHVKTRKARGQNDKTPWVFEDGEFKAKVPGQAICVCPRCKAAAFEHTGVMQNFSIRYDDEAKTKPRPQSLCKTCRKDHAKARRALDLPSA